MTADISFSRMLHFAQNAGLLSVLAKGPVKVEVQSLLRHSRYSIVFCSAHADFICVSRVILPNSLRWTVLMFVMETGYVLCEVGTGTLHAVCMNCRTPMIPPPPSLPPCGFWRHAVWQICTNVSQFSRCTRPHGVILRYVVIIIIIRAINDNYCCYLYPRVPYDQYHSQYSYLNQTLHYVCLIDLHAST